MLTRLAIRCLVFPVVLCAALLSAQTTSIMREPGPPIMSAPFPMMGLIGFGALENVPNAPFCATVLSGRIQSLADGNRIQQTSSHRICRDSKGRTRREMDPQSKADGTLHDPIMLSTIYDPVANVAYTLNERRHLAWKRPIRINTSSEFSNFLLSDRPNSRFFVNGKELKRPELIIEDLGEDSVNGILAKGTRTTRIIPAGEMGNEQPMKIVSERWYSDALKITLRVKQSDPRTGEMLTELTNVSTAEPAPALFQVPPDYTIEDAPGPRIGPLRPPSNPQ